MRKYILLVILLCLVPFTAYAIGVLFSSGDAPAGTPPGTEISDDFSSDNITDIEKAITVAAGVAKGANDYNDNYGYHTTQLSSANHYVQADCQWSNALNKTGGVVWRCDGNSTSSTGYYTLMDNSGSDARVILYEFSGSSVGSNGICTFSDQNFVDTNVYTIKVSHNASNDVSFYVDFNDDGDFADANEAMVDCLADKDTYTGQYAGVVISRGTSDSTVDNLEADPL